MQKCLSCGGIYEPIGADGVRYFHACPPLSAAELVDALRANAVQLGPVDQARLEHARKRDLANPPADGALSAESQVLVTLNVRRPNHRDENVVTSRTKTEDDVIVSEGDGAVDVTEADIAAAVTAADV